MYDFRDGSSLITWHALVKILKILEADLLQWQEQFWLFPEIGYASDTCLIELLSGLRTYSPYFCKFLKNHEFLIACQVFKFGHFSLLD